MTWKEACVSLLCCGCFPHGIGGKGEDDMGSMRATSLVTVWTVIIQTGLAKAREEIHFATHATMPVDKLRIAKACYY